MKHLLYFLILVVALLLICIAANGQVVEEWVARYNGSGNNDEVAVSLAVDNEGNVFVTGYSDGGVTELDFATIKYNAAGTQLWAEHYNSPANDYDAAVGLGLDADGNAYVTGFSLGVGTDHDWTTIKYSSAGVQQWVASYNGSGNGHDETWALAIDEEGNVYVTGSSIEVGSGSDYTTIKYNADGFQQWIVHYNGSANSSDGARAIRLDEDGNIYVAGTSIGLGTNNDYATIKYDNSGAQLWVARYTGPGAGFDNPYSICLDGEKNVYVTGYSTGSGTDYDYATLKYDSTGIQQWISRYNGPGNGIDIAMSVRVSLTKDVYITGYSWSSTFAYDYATIKYDSLGGQQWVNRYSGSNANDRAWALGLDNEGNIYVTGESWGGATNRDYATIKYDPSGLQHWVARYNGPGNQHDDANALVVDGIGNVYVTGNSTGNGTSYDFATIKYSQNTCLVTISLNPINPPLQIPASGGNFMFDIDIANVGTSPQTFDAWIMIYLPTGTWYGPVLGPFNLTLPVGVTLSCQRTQNVPASAPAGNYTYRGYVGTYSSVKWDSSSFDFVKLTTGDGLVINDWGNSGESFDAWLTQTAAVIPDAYELKQNYPNPFNPVTSITFQLPVTGQVSLGVYDLQGRLVASLVNGQRAAGIHTVTWDATDFASGLYFCKIEAGSFSSAIKMMLVK